MKHDIEEIRTAANAWYDGVTTERQEEMLREYFSNTSMNDIPYDLRTVARMMAGFRDIACEIMPETVIVRKPMYRKFWGYAVAASVAVCVMCGLFAKRTVYGYDYDGRAITDRQMAMESAECLECLSLLDENMEYLDVFYK